MAAMFFASVYSTFRDSFSVEPIAPPLQESEPQ
jgi:hypothetical protein